MEKKLAPSPTYRLRMLLLHMMSARASQNLRVRLLRRPKLLRNLSLDPLIHSPITPLQNPLDTLTLMPTELPPN